MTLNSCQSSGCDTTELLGRGKGSPSAVSNQPFLGSLEENLAQPLQPKKKKKVLEVNKTLIWNLEVKE